jgi:serine/threonine-protein kinase
MPDEPALLQVGDILAGKYRVDRLLGEGGMGLVVEAYHQLLDQRVAVKLLYRDVANAEAESRLLMEARATARLQSEHVARVFDVDVGKDGLPFIVMELLEGGDLCQLADARGALPPWLVVDYVLQTLEGLAHAHACGIIHRDLKPSNLFLTTRPDGSEIIKILDFGISKSSGGEVDRHTQQLTGGRTMLGSPPYMSPEQVRSPKTVDVRTDIWALGICMYELLTNSMPFGGTELQETFAQILEKSPAPIHTLVAGVPEGLEAIVMRCLAKDRDERFIDVAELAAALAPYGSGAWTSHVERVQATLARGAVEEAAISARSRGGARSSERIALPSSPSRRVDSIQPEFGTASTVARRFTVFDSKRTWLVAGMMAPAIVGIVLIGMFAFRRAPNGTESDFATRTDPPNAAVEPAPVMTRPPAASSAAAPAVTIDDLSEANPANVPGAPMDTSKISRPGASPSVTHASPPPRIVPKPAPVVPKAAPPALPPGLPQTRSGQ